MKLDPTALDAARAAHVQASHNGTYSPKGLQAAITAYLTALAPQTRAAVNTYNDAIWDVTVAQERNMSQDESKRRFEVCQAAEAALLALLGAEEPA